MREACIDGIKEESLFMNLLLIQNSLRKSSKSIIESHFYVKAYR